jgi:hypothetical protein
MCKKSVKIVRGKAYIIRVSESECEISLVAHYFKPGYGFTPQNSSFLAKLSSLQKLKVAIYKGFVILGRQK